MSSDRHPNIQRIIHWIPRSVRNLLEYFIIRNLVYSCTPHCIIIIIISNIIRFVLCSVLWHFVRYTYHCSITRPAESRAVKGEITLTHPSGRLHIPLLRSITTPELNEDRTRLSALLPSLLSPTPASQDKKKKGNNTRWHARGYENLTVQYISCIILLSSWRSYASDPLPTDHLICSGKLSYYYIICLTVVRDRIAWKWTLTRCNMVSV